MRPWVRVDVLPDGAAHARCLHCTGSVQIVAPTRALFDLQLEAFDARHALCRSSVLGCTCCAPPRTTTAQGRLFA